MDEIASLNWQIDPIEFGDVDTHAKPNMIGVSVEIVKVESNVKDTTLIVDFVLDLDTSSVGIEADARSLLHEPANTI